MLVHSRPFATTIAFIVCTAAATAVRAQETQSPSSTTDSSQPSSDDSNIAIVSGFVGSNFANNAEPASADFGGSIGYLWKGRYGAEFDVGLTPNFELENDFFGLGEAPTVGSFMANAIWAMPVGADKQWLPFVSGGVGAITLSSSLDDLAPDAGSESSDSRFGGNVGGGVMGFVGNWGFRADVRYFRATGTYDDTGTASMGSITTTPGGSGGIVYDSAGNIVTATPTTTTTTTTTSATTSSDSIAGAALKGLHFWRANAGVAFRW